jgi:hypothetical protein
VTVGLCAYVLRQENGTAVRCVALAAPRSDFCAFHARRRTVTAARSKKGGRDLDKDILPWSGDDQVCFDVARVRDAKARAALRRK